jgi:hypothetical protein
MTNVIKTCVSILEYYLKTSHVAFLIHVFIRHIELKKKKRCSVTSKVKAIVFIC